MLYILKFHVSLINSFVWFIVFIIFISFSIIIFIITSSEIIFLEFNILNTINWSINFVLIFDQIRTLFIFRVSLISLRVLKFSKRYINNDKNFIRFHYLLIRFILRIYFLILSPNIVSVLLGWDGLGLRSYLLVIYYGRSKAYNSGMITALTNRLGDSLILLRIGYLIIWGNWNIYFYVFKKIDFLVVVLLIIAATTKSAQIPFSAWLPAAIAAPTPVSSLVHSSTLVTAGVYLLIRHEFFFSSNNLTSYIIVIGTLTIILARLRALYETDLKKIVALSTLRQLGIMFLRLGLGIYLIRFFHLLTHAFFKALLFLATGRIIHRRKDYQDLRFTGRSCYSLPAVNRFILIARFSLIGFPFISAFFSKEIILEIIILKNFNLVIYLIIILGIRITALYRSRFIYLVFSSWIFNDLTTIKFEEDYYILRRICILLFPASLRGSWLYLFLINNLKLSVSVFLIKVFIVFIIFIRILLAISYRNYKQWKFYLWRIRRIWFLPFISAQLFNKIILISRVKIFKYTDHGIIKFNLRFIDLFTSSILATLRLKLISKILFLLGLWLTIIFLFYLCFSHYIKVIIKKAKIIICKIIGLNSIFFKEIAFLEVSFNFKKVITENNIIK